MWKEQGSVTYKVPCWIAASFRGQSSSTSPKVLCTKPLGGTWRITSVFRVLFISSPACCLLFCFHSSLKSLLICAEMRQEWFENKYQRIRQKEWQNQVPVAHYWLIAHEGRGKGRKGDKSDYFLRILFTFMFYIGEKPRWSILFCWRSTDVLS